MNNANQSLLQVETLKTTPGTLKALSAFISANRSAMSYEALDYYGLVRSMLRDQLAKPAARRATMQELSRRAFNLDAIICERPGALSSELLAPADCF